MSYNHKKVFFRRPILTQMNLFFWWFLFFTLIFIIPLTVFSVRFFSRLPDEVMRNEFKKYTITRLLEIPRSEIIGGDEEETGDFRSFTEPEEEPLADENSNVEIIEDPITPPSVLAREPEENSPLQKYQKSREVYEENIRKFEVKDEEVRIAKPNFTDFDVVQGYRSFEETITVGKASKKYIERCLDHYFSIHPRFRGKIIVKFDVHPAGHVIEESLSIEYSDISYDPILKCIQRSIYRWVKYPAVPQNRGIYSVTQKYIF